MLACAHAIPVRTEHVQRGGKMSLQIAGLKGVDIKKKVLL